MAGSVNHSCCQTFINDTFTFIAYDHAGSPIKNKDFAVMLSLSNPQFKSKILYKENHIVRSDSSGVISIAIGKGTPSIDNINANKYNGSEYFMTIEGIEMNINKDYRIFVGILIHISKTDFILKKPESTLTIGGKFAGGIIFDLDKARLHGKVVMETDFESIYSYGCRELRIFADSPIEGQINTILITKNCNETTAASKCLDFTSEGYDDWYLPSIMELELIYQTLFTKSSFSTGYYWSSTECKECKCTRSWGFKFDYTGKKVTIDKSRSVHVRAIRKF